MSLTLTCRKCSEAFYKAALAESDELDAAFDEVWVTLPNLADPTAADGASERLRQQLHKRIREQHLTATVELAREHQLEQVKLYAMFGGPGETEEDLEELDLNPFIVTDDPERSFVVDARVSLRE